eukprot:jgi/Bigna1/65157/fgenesh1_kg.98_\
MHHPHVASMHCCHHRDLFDSSRYSFNENEQKTTAEDSKTHPQLSTRLTLRIGNFICPQ